MAWVEITGMGQIFNLMWELSWLMAQLAVTMSKGYAIELYFDAALENQVLKAWNVLARRQISTQLIEIESRPHLTLFVNPLMDIPKLEHVIISFASKDEPLFLSFSSTGSLTNPKNVLFLCPTPSMSLLKFRSQLCDAMKKEGIQIGENTLRIHGFLTVQRRKRCQRIVWQRHSQFCVT